MADLNVVRAQEGLDPEMRKYHKETQVSIETSTVACNTDISLVHKIYDEFLKDKKTIDDLIEERKFKNGLNLRSKLIPDDTLEYFRPQDYTKQLAQVIEDTIKPTFNKLVHGASYDNINPLLLARNAGDLDNEDKVSVTPSAMEQQRVLQTTRHVHLMTEDEKKLTLPYSETPRNNKSNYNIDDDAKSRVSKSTVGGSRKGDGKKRQGSYPKIKIDKTGKLKRLKTLNLNSDSRQAGRTPKNADASNKSKFDKSSDSRGHTIQAADHPRKPILKSRSANVLNLSDERQSNDGRAVRAEPKTSQDLGNPSEFKIATSIEGQQNEPNQIVFDFKNHPAIRKNNPFQINIKPASPTGQANLQEDKSPSRSSIANSNHSSVSSSAGLQAPVQKLTFISSVLQKRGSLNLGSTSKEAQAIKIKAESIMQTDSQKSPPKLRKAMTTLYQSELIDESTGTKADQSDVKRKARLSIASVNDLAPRLGIIKETLDSDSKLSQSGGSVISKLPIPIKEVDPKTKLLRKQASEQFEVQFNNDFSKNLDFSDQTKIHNTFVMVLENLTFEMNRAIQYGQLLDKTREEMQTLQQKFTDLESEHKQCSERENKLTTRVTALKDDRDKLISELQQFLKESPAPVQQLELKSMKQVKRKSHIATKESNKIRDLVHQLGRALPNFGHHNNAKHLISVLGSGSFTQFKNPMPLKSILKSIHTIYSEKIKDAKKSQESKKTDFDDYVYDYYMQVFGIKEIGEKKFCYFILSLKYHAQFFRVNLFSRFMGLLPSFKYNQEQISKYLEGIEYLEANPKGFPVKNLDTSARVMYPISRAEDFLKHVFERRISLEELYEMRKKMEEFREEDKTGRNVGLIDADVFLEKVIEKYGSIVNRTKQYVVDAFESADLDGNKACSVNEWVLLCRFIEPKTFELGSCIQLFFSNANKVVNGDNCMSFDKFAAVCTDSRLFSEENQSAFLGLTPERPIEVVYREIRENWSQRYRQLKEQLQELYTLADEEVDRWKENLEVLNHTIVNKSDVASSKATIMAYKMFVQEFERIKSEEATEQEELFESPKVTLELPNFRAAVAPPVISRSQSMSAFDD